MTGPGPGKVMVRDAKVFIAEHDHIHELNGAEVYIHLKGYSYARVTHLDIEHPELDNVIEDKGGYFKIEGIPYGIVIHINENKRIVVRHRAMNEILADGENTFTWVGSKTGGIYVGFKKKYIPKLEKLAYSISKEKHL